MDYDSGFAATRIEENMELHIFKVQHSPDKIFRTSNCYKVKVHDLHFAHMPCCDYTASRWLVAAFTKLLIGPSRSH
jgi:hypothetical protein